MSLNKRESLLAPIALPSEAERLAEGLSPLRTDWPPSSFLPHIHLSPKYRAEIKPL